MDVIEEAIKLNHAPSISCSPRPSQGETAPTCWTTGTRCVAVSRLLREQPMVIEIDRTTKPYDDFQRCREIARVGQQEGRLSLLADGHHHKEPPATLTAGVLNS